MRLAINAAGILALTTAVIAQVQVTVTTDKPEYVQGEPIIVVLEVQNESSGPVGYPWDVSVAIPDAHERVLPNLLGCSGGMGGGSGLGRSHEPTLKPGETRRFEYVVRGYDLAPGAYQLQIVGTGGVGWSGRGVGTASTAASGSQSRFRRDYRVVVGERDEARLTEAMARLVAAAQATGQDSAIAKEAILEAAPPFLEPLIAEFAADVQLQHRAVAALGRMNTRASRASLRSMFDSSTDVGLRHGITLSLARTGERDNLELFSRLLRDTADSDPTLANYAALGAGFIGGEEAVEGLRWGTSASSTLVRDGVLCENSAEV